MADVRQAVMWVKQGKRVIRRGWTKRYLYLPKGDTEVWYQVREYRYPMGWDVDDLLAKDWEILKDA